jgi:predicted O-methyltransferase YrrM
MDARARLEHVPTQPPAAEAPRRVLERLAADATVISRLDGTAHTVFPVAISLVEGQALRTWVVRERASRTLEIGLGYAVSALHVCEGLLTTGAPAPTHLAIDPYQHSRFADCGLQLLEDGDVRGLVEHMDGRSELVLPELLKSEARFDLAFVDGNHRFDAVFVDLFYLGRLVRPASVIFLDDYQLAGVRKAVAFCVRNLHWTMLEQSDPHSEHQWAVVRTSATPDDRPFTYFVDF